MKIASFLSMLLVPALVVAADSPPAHSIIPRPRQITVQDGAFELTNATRIVTDKPMLPVGQFLSQTLAPATGREIPVSNAATDPADDTIVIRTAESSAELGKEGFGKEGLGKEGYRLKVTPRYVLLEAAEPQGAIWAVQTLRQLLPTAILSKERVALQRWNVACVEITDQPRFPWRGFMIDCSRTFVPFDELKRYVDVLSFYKMNVLHLHLTDDQGWRIEIKKYPRLTERGSQFDPRYDQPAEFSGYYTQSQLRELVAYAEQRGVTVMPEIDMPGHSWPLVLAYPEFTVFRTKDPSFLYPYEVWPQIRDKYYPDRSAWTQGTFDPTNDKTYAFIDDLLEELLDIFPSPYIHVGGDEVDFTVWERSERLTDYMREHDIPTPHHLQAHFLQRVNKLIRKRGRTMIGWDEILYGGLPEGATVMAWRGHEKVLEAGAAKAPIVVANGAALYLDHWQGPKLPGENVKGDGTVVTQEEMYKYHPMAGLSPEQKDRVVGMQGQMWTHVARSTREIHLQVFPRLLAIAESAWLPEDEKDYADFVVRKQQHDGRLTAHGVHFWVDRSKQRREKRTEAP